MAFALGVRCGGGKPLPSREARSAASGTTGNAINHSGSEEQLTWPMRTVAARLRLPGR